MFLIFMYCIIVSVNALYEDQVGDFDWYQQYIGHVTWSSLEQSVGTRRKVLLASHEGAIAAVNAGPGSIAWRQSLNEPLINVLHHRSTILTLSGDTRVILRCWDIETGFLKWEVPTLFDVPVKIFSLSARWRPGGLLMATGGSKNDQLIISGSSLVVVYSLRYGKELWNVTLDKDHVPVYLTSHSSNNVVRLWYLSNHHLFANDINLNDKKHSEHFKMTEYTQWLNANISCDITDNNTIICIEPVQQKIYVCINTELFEPLTLESSDIVVSFNDIIRAYSDSIIRVSNQLVTMDTVNKLGQVICTQCDIGISQQVTVRIEAIKHQLKIHSTTNDVSQSVSIDSKIDRGGVVNVDVFILNKASGKNNIWRALVYREDASISFISNTGELIWCREEGLSNIVSVETIDLPNLQTATEGFLNLLEQDVNPLLLSIKRLNFQFGLVQSFIKDVINRGVASVISPVSTEQLVRDNFNIRKLLVTVTSYNKLYALDTNDGKIVWQLYIPGLRLLTNKIFVLRSSVDVTNVAVLVGVSSLCNGSMLHEFNLINGQLTNQICLPYHVIQTLLLPFADHTHQRTLLLLDNEGHIHCYPDDCELKTSVPIFLYTADAINGRLNGFHVKGAELPTKEVWQTILPKNERMLHIVSNGHGHTHSMGRVRADRSVQYKYLNPNLVAMATESTDDVKPNLNIYLLDVINGGVVYHVTHKFASNPINIVLCENWMIYTFYNMKSYRHEIVVVELYDYRNETESVWSSLAPPILPVSTTQSYTYTTGIVSLSYTVTQRSITHKSLLFGLSSGHIISIHKDLLDPRRNITPTQEMMDEGIPPYIPLLPVEPKYMINYNQTVANIHGIHTASTGLESTCLVFAYGLDLYLTRVTPSKQFDMLAEDFDYLLITAVVSVLTLATIFLSYFASRKNLNLLWK